jgi:hypothetical protein
LHSDVDDPGLAAVAVAPPRRRLTTGAHADFVSAIVQEFRGTLAPLKGASELVARRRRDLGDDVLGDLCAVIDRQANRVAWLVRLLEAVDGDASARRLEDVDGPTVARQAAATTGTPLAVAPDTAREQDLFPGDPERVRLGLEILFEALASPAGPASASAPAPGFLTVTAPALDLDEPPRRFGLRAAFRVLDSEGCQLRIRHSPTETRAEVRFGRRAR